MKPVTLTVPELGLIVGTRAAAGAGLAPPRGAGRPEGVATVSGGRNIVCEVVAHGPCVRNTRDEIVQEFRNYQSGAFRRSPSD